MDRKEAIEKLANIIFFRDGSTLTHGLRMRYLNNVETAAHCQIFECAYGTDGNVSLHKHEKSKEVFYQVQGSSIFNDGQVLHAGELKVIPVNVLHSVTLSADGLYIVIVHPSENAYIRG